ncbi:MAG: exopolyphosphatase / guanosine-5-triphosphate,3-diphosphate pyrophosphatase [Actinomycetota bacterium]|jgi:exopolyphosphatase/guanosine-5'-triphosphate,3'-diphosphate pyrophosphatase|nr:exopolyphosphatase / guanosine-5-triphosphate,3-diphosphate pyrophosphatase [Actinomycetota bacterium]
MRIGALDLGSNSFHLLVADVHPDGTFESVTREKDMLRLGDEVAREGLITETTARRVVESARHLKQIADASGATEVIAKATSALRSASNGSEVVDQIEAATDIDVEVINGQEEARLIFAAIRASVVIDPSPALCIDLGGGSVELMVGDANRLLWVTSLNLGVGRLTERFVHSDPPSKSERNALEAYLRETLEPVAKEVAQFSPQMAVGSSGTLSDLAAMVVASQTGEEPRSRNQLTVSRDEFLPVHERIVRAKTSDRRRMDGLEEKRAELIVAGSMFLAVAMDVFGFERITISEWALREGIILDAVGHHDPDDWSDDPRALRRAAIASLARRCQSDPDHTRNVARLALQLFDATSELHGLGAADRELLEYAVLLHDIGQHVSRQGHHRHAAYLVEHAQLRGFSPDEVTFLAALVRHHRRGDPKPSEPLYGALSNRDRERVRRLAAILRVADGLDRGRRGGVTQVSAQITDNLVILRVRAQDDAELELWATRRRRDLFEKVFDRELEVVVEPATRTATVD